MGTTLTWGAVDVPYRATERSPSVKPSVLLTLLALTLVLSVSGSAVGSAGHGLVTVPPTNYVVLSPPFANATKVPSTNFVEQGCTALTAASKFNFSSGQGLLLASGSENGCGNGTASLVTGYEAFALAFPVTGISGTTVFKAQFTAFHQATWKITPGTCKIVNSTGSYCNTAAGFGEFASLTLYDVTLGRIAKAYGGWLGAPSNGSTFSTSCSGSSCSNSSIGPLSGSDRGSNLVSLSFHHDMLATHNYLVTLSVGMLIEASNGGTGAVIMGGASSVDCSMKLVVGSLSY